MSGQALASDREKPASSSAAEDKVDAQEARKAAVHKEVFTKGTFYAQMFLHKKVRGEVFTQRNVYTEQL